MYDHTLAGDQTITKDRGLLLDQTLRLHPKICHFTSELFYERRLRPRPGLEIQNIIAKPSSSRFVTAAALVASLTKAHSEGRKSACPTLPQGSHGARADDASFERKAGACG
jgi:hypothetical protein